MVLLLVYFLSSHPVDLESLAKLVELVLEHQMDLLFEMLSWLTKGSIKL